MKEIGVQLMQMSVSLSIDKERDPCHFHPILRHHYHPNQMVHQGGKVRGVREIEGIEIGEGGIKRIGDGVGVDLPVGARFHHLDLGKRGSTEASRGIGETIQDLHLKGRTSHLTELYQIN